MTDLFRELIFNSNTNTENREEALKNLPNGELRKDSLGPQVDLQKLFPGKTSEEAAKLYEGFLEQAPPSELPPAFPGTQTMSLSDLELQQRYLRVSLEKASELYEIFLKQPPPSDLPPQPPSEEQKPARTAETAIRPRPVARRRLDFRAIPLYKPSNNPATEQNSDQV